MATEIESPPAVTETGPTVEAFARRVVRLPDTRFFVRSIPIAAEANAADAAAQAELALETLSPFPVAQLYHGYFWKTGQARALVFAAFKRRFTADETEDWKTADLVIPCFASVVGLAPATGTTVVLPGEGWLTAVHWNDETGVPSRVVTEPVPADASDDVRARIREGLIRSLGGSLRVIDLAGSPELHGTDDEDENDFEFIVADRRSKVEANQVDAIDVRDKAELLSRRKAKARDVMLWRTALVLCGLLLLSALAEVGLVALKYWQDGRLQTVARQQPLVEKVMTNQSVTRRIELLSDRLRPFEMIEIAADKPESIQFDSTEAREGNVLVVKATTRVAADVGAYEAQLRANPAVAKIESVPQREQDGVSTFSFVLTFHADALKQASVKP